MSHKEVLKLLLPIKIDGCSDKDIEVEGRQLDKAQSRAEGLLNEFFPDQSYELLSDWERICGINTNNSYTLQLRRSNVIQKLRETRAISIPYLTRVAQMANVSPSAKLSMAGWMHTGDALLKHNEIGYIVNIEELQPCMAGISKAGDVLYRYECIWIWRVDISNYHINYFRAGQSIAGERLTWWRAATAIEDALRELKPAHTFVYFNYS